jgi:hypothetical protein
MIDVSGWRKRQIALDVKAENARELGLDYEPVHVVGGMDLAQPELVDYKKLAALGWQAIECGICGGGAMGYPQRPWVGLTDEELADCMDMSIQKTCRAIEAKLKEKNT